MPGRLQAVNEIIRRKIERQHARPAETARSPATSLALAFARAASEGARLMVGTTSAISRRRTMDEALELIPEPALLLLLARDDGAPGVVALATDLMAALIESRTTGRLLTTAPTPRRPTQTDAVMVSDIIDGMLSGFEALLAGGAEAPWARGFRYTSFLDDMRSLCLLLDQEHYFTTGVEMTLGDGERIGRLELILPAEAPDCSAEADEPQGESSDADLFQHGLKAGILAANCELDAVIARLTRSLGTVMALEPGTMLPLPAAGVDRITLEGINGEPVSRARLGQFNGMRALRLSGDRDPRLLTASPPRENAAMPGPAAGKDAPPPAVGKKMAGHLIPQPGAADEGGVAPDEG